MRDLVRRPSGLPDLSNGSSSSCLRPLLKSGCVAVFSDNFELGSISLGLKPWRVR